MTNDHLGTGNEQVYQCSSCEATIAMGTEGIVKTHRVRLRCVECDKPFGSAIERRSDRQEDPYSYGPDPWG